MLNIEGTLVRYLSEITEIPTFVEVPKNPKDNFITVERTGGAFDSKSVFDRPTVVIDSYGKTRSLAWHISEAVDRAVKDMPGVIKGVSFVEPNAICVHYPDVESRHERYESTYLITTYDYKKG